MDPQEYVKNISNSGLTIYDPIKIGDEKLWLPINVIESILSERLIGLSLSGLPLRTRSKCLKSEVSKALGYPVPKTFKKTRPRFYGQMFDTYVQKSNNLQIWNEEISPSRRYVLVKVSNDDIIESVRVVDGKTIARLDKTGTWTQKYQASIIVGTEETELITTKDTDNLMRLFKSQTYPQTFSASPIEHPKQNELLPIREIYGRLKSLVKRAFDDAGIDQERNRAAMLHKLVCTKLGYKSFQDDGRFPDIRHQLVEVKLQTSPTIDLGLICPDSTDPLDIAFVDNVQIHHCDVRYAIFYAITDGTKIKITNFYLTTGESFFDRFTKFQGKIVNKKLQIPLPKDFFKTKSKNFPD